MPEDETTAVATAILRYLEKNPFASDTTENIGRWWLPAGLGSSPTSVALAIEALLANGTLVARTRPDGTVLYGRRHGPHRGMHGEGTR